MCRKNLYIGVFYSIFKGDFEGLKKKNDKYKRFGSVLLQMLQMEI